jgi:predicted glycosyltransferase
LTGAARPTLIVYCRVSYGAGHWVRCAALMSAFTQRFRVVLALRGQLTPDLAVPADVDVVELTGTASLSALADFEKPAAVMVEYFPFGRDDAADELLPMLVTARKSERRPFVFCSLRDVQQCRRNRQTFFDTIVTERVNRYFDAVFVHSDPRLFPLERTFAPAARLRAAVHHTGYVAAETGRISRAPSTPPRIVVSGGGGRGGEQLFRDAIDAQRELAGEFTMRLFGGTYLDEETWRDLEQRARGVARLDLVRWTPDLPRELAAAAVSVSRCGYNTAIDLLRTGVPALVVPFSTPTEDEQTRRAAELAHRGVVQIARPEETLAAAIRRTAGTTPAAIDVDLGGAQRSLALLSDACA